MDSLNQKKRITMIINYLMGDDSVLTKNDVMCIMNEYIANPTLVSNDNRKDFSKREKVKTNLQLLISGLWLVITSQVTSREYEIKQLKNRNMELAEKNSKILASNRELSRYNEYMNRVNDVRLVEKKKKDAVDSKKCQILRLALRMMAKDYKRDCLAKRVSQEEILKKYKDLAKAEYESRES